MDVVDQWVALREVQNNEEAVTLLADDASFVTPNETKAVVGRNEILTWLNAHPTPKVGSTG